MIRTKVGTQVGTYSGVLLLSHEIKCTSGIVILLTLVTGLILALALAFALWMPLNYRLFCMCPLCHLCGHF